MRTQKLRLSITAIFLCMLLVCGSAGALAADVFTDVQFFGGTGRDSVYEALPLQNGNLLLVCETQEGQAGRAQLSEWDALGWLVCLAPDGSVAWEKTYGEMPGQNVVASPAQQADGTIAIWNHHSVKQVMGSVRVLTLTEDGEEISRSERGKDWPYVVPMGENFWIEDYENKQYVLQNADGKTLWSVPYSGMPKFIEHPIMTQDGIVFDGRLGPDENHAAIGKLSRNGSPMWLTEVKISDQSRFESFIETSEGNILAVGGAAESAEVSSWRNSKGLAVLLGKNGNILWQNQYSMEMEKDGAIVYDVAETQLGYVVLYTSRSQTRLTLMLLDKQGNELKRMSYQPGKEVYSLPKFVRWNGDIWVYGGVERKSSGADVILMRLDVGSLLQEN